MIDPASTNVGVVMKNATGSSSIPVSMFMPKKEVIAATKPTDKFMDIMCRDKPMIWLQLSFWN